MLIDDLHSAVDKINTLPKKYRVAQESKSCKTTREVPHLSLLFLQHMCVRACELERSSSPIENIDGVMNAKHVQGSYITRTLVLKMMAKTMATQIMMSRRMMRFLVALFWYFSAVSRFL